MLNNKRKKPDYTLLHLDYLRGRILNESISYGELAKLQSLKEHIDPGDVLQDIVMGRPGGSHTAGGRVYAHETHYCDDGGCGVADIQGYRVV